MTLLEPLYPEAERLLAVERNLVPASPELRTRVMARARAALRAGAVPTTRLGWRGRVPATLAAALVLGIAALSLAAWRARRVEEPPRSDAAAPVAPAPAPSPSPVTPDPEATPAARVQGPAPVPVRKDDTAPTPRRVPDADAYAAELGLLQQARAAVVTSRFSAALDSIAEHERRFAAGRLREERDALRIKALAGLGRGDDARAAAERFRARYPRSVLLPGIEAATRRGP
jgi:hypothetical protein